MAAEKSPAFQFYPRDYLSDPNVVAMTNAERGMYMTLLCLCWIDQSIPADPAELARLVGCRQKRFVEVWNLRLQRCFSRRDDGRLIQKRLELERGKQKTFSELQTRRGRAGGLAKASRGLARAHAKPECSSSSSTAVLTPLPPLKGGRRPLTRAEREFADAVLRNRFGRCHHDPPCANQAACAEQIAYDVREKGQASG